MTIRANDNDTIILFYIALWVGSTQIIIRTRTKTKSLRPGLSCLSLVRHHGLVLTIVTYQRPGYRPPCIRLLIKRINLRQLIS